MECGMRSVEFGLDGRRYCVTTEHAASSYGRPVLVVDGELADVACRAEAAACSCSALGLLADAAGIHGGPRTRAALGDLADELLAGLERPTGADYDAVIAEFRARGKALAARPEN